MLVLLVILHVFGAAFWFGAVLLLAFVVEPSIQRAGGEAAAAVGAQLARRIPPAMAGAGITTILSGLLLFGLDSGGFNAGFMRSAAGQLFLLGALCGFAAVGAGMMFPRVSVERGVVFARISAAFLACALALMVIARRA